MLPTKYGFESCKAEAVVHDVLSIPLIASLTQLYTDGESRSAYVAALEYFHGGNAADVALSSATAGLCTNVDTGAVRIEQNALAIRT